MALFSKFTIFKFFSIFPIQVFKLFLYGYILYKFLYDKRLAANSLYVPYTRDSFFNESVRNLERSSGTLL